MQSHHRPIIRRLDQVAMGDVIGPDCAAVGFACKWGILCASLYSPLAIQTACSERAEVSSIRSDGFDNHEILLLAGDSVHLHRLEQIISVSAQDFSRFGSEIRWEVTNWHACAIHLSIVACKEEMHAFAIANDGASPPPMVPLNRDCASDQPLASDGSLDVRYENVVGPH